MLMQQGDGLDQGQQLRIIAPRPRRRIREVGHLHGMVVCNLDGPEQPLRVAMQPHHLRAVAPRPQSLDGLRFALLLMDRPRLFLLFIHAQHQAAVQQLLVHVLRGRGQEDHHRAFDQVFMRHHLSVHRVFAGRCDLELAFRLQQLQRVRRAAGPFLFGNREDLCFRFSFAPCSRELARSWRSIPRAAPPA